MNFSVELVADLYRSGEEFPVLIEDAAGWLGYSRKDNAIRAIASLPFKEGVDYCSEIAKDVGRSPGRPSRKISLTCNCLRDWAGLLNTPEGREVYSCFLEFEEATRAIAFQSDIGLAIEVNRLKKELAELRDEVATLKTRAVIPATNGNKVEDSNNGGLAAHKLPIEDLIRVFPSFSLPLTAATPWISSIEWNTAYWFYYLRSHVNGKPNVRTRKELLWHLYGVREGRGSSTYLPKIGETLGHRVNRIIAELRGGFTSV